MANNRMYLVHRPTGKAIYLAKHSAGPWGLVDDVYDRLYALFDDPDIHCSEDFVLAYESPYDPNSYEHFLKSGDHHGVHLCEVSRDDAGHWSSIRSADPDVLIEIYAPDEPIQRFFGERKAAGKGGIDRIKPAHDSGEEHTWKFITDAAKEGWMFKPVAPLPEVKYVPENKKPPHAVIGIKVKLHKPEGMV